jgi:hypothetical protein
MSLSKNIIIDKIEVLENGSLQIRQRTDIIEDSNTLSSSYQRWTLNPGQDTTGQDPRVIAVATAIWTADVVSAYKAQLASSINSLSPSLTNS